MTTSLPNALGSQVSISVFDLSGHQILELKQPTIIIEPAALIADKNGLSITEKIQTIHANVIPEDIIGIKFDKFADGRSYSIAARLREAGYRGPLHAMGDINQELVFLLRRVGFTHFHLPDFGTSTLPFHILEPFAGYYQGAQDGSQAPWQKSASSRSPVSN